MGSEEFEQQQDIEKETATTFERLHLLVQKGYRPDFAMEFTKSIWLHHPSENFPHKDLILYPSGLVVSQSDSDNYRFHRNEQRQFQEFLRQVPRPTLMDRTRDFRTKVMVAILMVGLLIVLPWILGNMFDTMFGRR
jgi:hypothetical protein